MGQLFNRISRIFQSNINTSNDFDAAKFIKSEDDELKRIIDSLNNKSNSNNSNNSQKQNYSENIKPDSSIENAFKVFGLNINASVQDIKNAYRSKMKENHPDKVDKSSDDVKAKARQKTQEINSAYQILKKYKNFS